MQRHPAYGGRRRRHGAAALLLSLCCASVLAAQGADAGGDRADRLEFAMLMPGGSGIRDDARAAQGGDERRAPGNGELPAVAPQADPLAGSGFDAPALASFTSMVNAIRARARQCGSAGHFPAAAPVSYDPRLAGASLAHVIDMIERDYFAHVGAPSAKHPAGSRLVGRVRAAGYPWTVGPTGRGSAAAEVLGRGHRGFRQMLAGWLASPRHCAALMSGSMRQFGVAAQVRADDVPLWAMVLARPPH